MEILNGKRGMITERDESILQDLFLAPGLSTRQLSRMYFDSVNTAKYRMYQLRKKGLVVNLVHKRGPAPSEVLWKLSKKALEREEEAAGRAGKRFRSWPKGRISHLIDVNDVFVEVSYGLDEVLGRFPGWEWIDEPRASERYEFAGTNRQHQPDAEVRFRGLRFFIERETKRAKETPEAFLRKMAGYQAYTQAFGIEGQVQIIFACDTERDVRYALSAGREYRVPVFAGNLEEAARYLLQQAARLVKQQEGRPS